MVAIGGGRGLATALRAARRYADDITAVVSVADDGGSSGELSEAYGLVSPGDLRKCLVALAGEGRITSDMFEYRFDSGPLVGHPLGNLIIAGLTELCGSVLPAIEVCASLLGSSGRVLPVTTERIELEARLPAGHTMRGQARITASAKDIDSVRIIPEDPKPSPGVVEAISVADQIIIGPGSLYTSVVPPLLIAEVRDAVSSSPASKVYVCNLTGQQSESAGLSVADHYRALSAHGIACDVILYHPWGHYAPKEAVLEGDLERLEAVAVACYLADSADPSRHDPGALASALAGLLR